jgi:type IV pilus biogenesis protein CpaD/CtpE
MKLSLVSRSVLLLAGAILLHGCSSAEKEPTPLVAVQVAPAKRGPIELEVTSDAVVYPLLQAILSP